MAPGYRESTESWADVMRDLRDRDWLRPCWRWVTALWACGQPWTRSSPPPKVAPALLEPPGAERTKQAAQTAAS